MSTKSTTKSTDDESYSSYWLDDSVDVIDSDDSSMERLLKLASIRRAIANFVRIITNDSTISVRFSSGKESYTDGKTVVISADADAKHFDSMVGLALHEGSHCLLSDFNFLQAIQQEYTFYRCLHPKLRKLFPVSITDPNFSQNDLNTVRTLKSYMMNLMNVIEDRRIDSFVYKAAPGYQPYYKALYKRYFFNREVENNLRRNPDWRVPSVENYINWLILIFSPHFNPRAMRGLTKMVNIIDLPNIRRFDEKHMPPDAVWQFQDGGFVYDYNQFPLLWKVANELMIEILRQVKFQAIDYAEMEKLLGDLRIVGGQFTDFNEDVEGEGGDMDNLDSPESGRFNDSRGKKALEKIKRGMRSGGIRRKKLTRSEREQINTMEDASAKIAVNGDAVFGKIPCLVTREMNKQILSSSWFPFVNTRYWGGISIGGEPSRNIYAERGVLDGLRMGSILAQRLSVRNDSTVTHHTRQQHGKIDRRILAQLGMDIDSVFKRVTVDQYSPVLLYLSLDASGSMGSMKWQKVISVATALAYAAEKIRNLDVVISLRGNNNNDSKLMIPCVSVVYDSRKDNFKKVRELFPYLCPTGSTPEGLCYNATLELLQECVATHTTYFINFSDGAPGDNVRFNDIQYNYRGAGAYKQTKNMVRQIREAGVEVLSYFIEDTESKYSYTSDSTVAFRKMYGQTAEFVNVQNVTQVLRTLNKLLLRK